MAVGAIGSAYGMDAMRKSVSGGEEHRMLPYDDVMLQPRSMAPSSRTKTFDLPYPHFALMYIDRNGELGLEASPSLAGCGRAIFTEEVRDRFLKTAAAGGQPSMQPRFGLASFGKQADLPMTDSIPGFSFQQNSSWYQSGLSKSTELIPCEWQSQHQTKRQRRNGAMDRRGSDSMSPGPIKRTALRVGNQDLLRRYYEKAFENFQQLNCRVIAKAFIKLVEPRKQVNHPYNGRKTSAGAPQRIDPELTKPKWWPTGVTHKEPDHLLKAAEKLKEAGQDVRRQIVPSERLHVLDEIYYVRHMEECYLKGEIDGDTTIHVSHVHLAEANFEFDHHEQDASQSPQDQSVPTVTVKADGSSLTDDQTQKRNSDNDAVPSWSFSISVVVSIEQQSKKLLGSQFAIILTGNDDIHDAIRRASPTYLYTKGCPSHWVDVYAGLFHPATPGPHSWATH
ncbi:hypothetical protein MW887_002628 [Aspergillus wentii]|nr:hypothetical protein MW887_002628 [Aspergillus wentii]